MWSKPSQPVAALAAARSTTVHAVHIKSQMKILFENTLYLFMKLKLVKIRRDFIKILLKIFYPYVRNQK